MRTKLIADSNQIYRMIEIQDRKFKTHTNEFIARDVK